MSKTKRISPEDLGVDEENLVEETNQDSTQTNSERSDEGVGNGKKETVFSESQVKEMMKSFNQQLEVLKSQIEATKQAQSGIVSMVEVQKKAMESMAIQKKLLVEKLKNQPKVQMVIPSALGEKPGATHEVGINGVVFVYPKGKLIQVPESVAALLMDHFNITAEAGKEFRSDRKKDIEDALA